MQVSKLFSELLSVVRDCRHCEQYLPHQPRPVVQASATARILIISQAPGRIVHNTGIPFNDKSGDKLREWMGIDKDIFYDKKLVAIVPMGLCYPGKGKSGDLPPRPECAPLWHERIMNNLRDLKLTLLVGAYAQRYYLTERQPTLTETVRAYREYQPGFFPLVHPSPRNIGWQMKNPWFELELIPELRRRVSEVLV